MNADLYFHLVSVSNDIAGFETFKFISTSKDNKLEYMFVAAVDIPEDVDKFRLLIVPVTGASIDEMMPTAGANILSISAGDFFSLGFEKIRSFGNDRDLKKRYQDGFGDWYVRNIVIDLLSKGKIVMWECKR